MFHTLAWALAGAQDVLTDITPLPDNVFLIQNGHFVPQVNYQALYGLVAVTNPDRAQWNNASIRQFSPIQVSPMEAVLTPGNQPNVADYRQSSFQMRELEEFILEAEQGDVAATVISGLLGITKAFVPAPVGTNYSIRITSVTAAVANTWTQLVLAFQDTLPTGNYACTGLRHMAVGAVSARLIFEDQVERPGCVSGTLESDATAPMFYRGGLGQWGRFTSNRMPNIEVFCNAATAVHTLIMDFVRTS